MTYNFQNLAPKKKLVGLCILWASHCAWGLNFKFFLGGITFQKKLPKFHQKLKRTLKKELTRFLHVVQEGTKYIYKNTKFSLSYF